MLLFKPQHKELILNGTKTQTRRDWKKCRAKVGSVHLCKLKMLSKEYFAIIEILKVWKENLEDISEEDAVQEGYGCKEEFLKVFEEINPKYDGKNKIWVVKFALVEHGGKDGNN